MKYATFAAAAALVSGSMVHAQDAGDAAVDTATDATEEASAGSGDQSVIIEDSFDDNRDYENTDSFNDNSADTFNDSFDDNSDNISFGIGKDENVGFGDGALVAETALSNVVTGVVVDYDDVAEGAVINNRLVNRGNAFRNSAGMNALNQNTGVGASQNAAVTIAVSGDGFGPE